MHPLAERLKRAGYPVYGPNPQADGALQLYANDPDGLAMEWWGKEPDPGVIRYCGCHSQVVTTSSDESTVSAGPGARSRTARLDRD